MKKAALLFVTACFVTLCVAAAPGFDLVASVEAVGRGRLGGGPSAMLVAWTQALFGWTAAGLVRSFLASWVWLAVIFAALVGVGLLPRRARRWAGAGLVVILVAASAQGIYRGTVAWGERWADLRLAAPQELLARLGDRTAHVFLNPTARNPVAALDPGVVEGSPPPQAASALMRSPAQWRAADRDKPFSAVLLAGRPSEAAPLIAHLSDSPDWYLASVDNQGLLFLRGDKRDDLNLPNPSFGLDRDRAVFLAQAALSLEAAGDRVQASRRMDEAMGIGGNDYDVLVRAAMLAASQGRWERARKLSLRALEKRPGGFEASYLLAWSLLETRDVEGAFAITSKLARSHPRDLQILLLHARAARAAKDFRNETRTLESVLPLVRGDDDASARIHVYLGQSWAQRGFPKQALENYRRALEGPLSPAEAADVRGAVKTIEDRQPGGGTQADAPQP